MDHTGRCTQLLRSILVFSCVASSACNSEPNSVSDAAIESDARIAMDASLRRDSSSAEGGRALDAPLANDTVSFEASRTSDGAPQVDARQIDAWGLDVRSSQDATVLDAERDAARDVPEAAADTHVNVCDYFRGTSSLRYFGFYCSSCSWVGTGDYAEEIQTELGANVSFVSGEPDDIRRGLNKARTLGMHAVVSLVNGVFRCDYPDIPPAENFWCFTPERDATWSNLLFERWTSLVPDLERALADGTLIAFYVGDDRSPPDTPSSNAYLRRIRDTFTHPVKLMVAVYVGDTAIAEEVDWVAYEYYWGGGPTTELAALRPHQQVVLMPAVYVQPVWHEFMPVEQVLDTALATLRNNDRVVMLMPFLWQSTGTGAGALTGGRDIPSYRARLNEVGDCLTGRFPLLRDGGLFSSDGARD